MKSLINFFFQDKEPKNVSIKGEGFCFYLFFCFCEVQILIPFINSCFENFILNDFQIEFIFLLANLIFIKIFFGKNFLSKMILGRERLDLKIAAKDFFCGLFVSFFVYPVVFFITSFFFGCLGFTDSFLNQSLIVRLKQSSISSLFGFISIWLLLAPVIEEIIFRGFVQNFFKSKFGNIVSIIITSTIFALMHTDLFSGNFDVIRVIPLFFMSLLCGLIYEINGTALAAMGFHIGYNFIFLILIMRFLRLS